MPTRKNRKQSFKSVEKSSGKGADRAVLSGNDRNPIGKEFPTQNRDLGPRIIKLRK